MSRPLDLELKKAFLELHYKTVESNKKIQVIDSQIHVLNRVLMHLGVTQQEVGSLPPETKTYEAVGRMFLHTNQDEVKNNLKIRMTQLTERTTDLENNKQYLEKNLKETEENIREMVRRKKTTPSS